MYVNSKRTGKKKTLRKICSEQTVTFRNDNIVQNGARKISSLAKKGKQET